MLFTIDTNCIIDLETNSEFAEPLRELVAAHRRGEANVAMPSISASELQRDGTYLERFDDFRERVVAADLGDLPLIDAIAYWGISFYGCGYLANESMSELERKIHAVLHADIEMNYQEFCERRGLQPDTVALDPRWRNAMCDTQALWSYVHHPRDCFVTRDKNFLKKTKLPALAQLGAGRILLPTDAVRILRPAA